MALAAGDLRPGQAELARAAPRRACVPTGASIAYAPPLTVSSGTRPSPPGCPRGGRGRGSRARRAWSRPRRLDLGQHAPRARAPCVEQLADLRRAPARVARSRSSQALSASPSTPDRVRLPHPEERRRHREVLVDARERHRLRERRRRRSAVGRLWRRRLAVGDPVRVAGEHLRASASSSKPATLRGAQRDQRASSAGWPYG